MFAILSRIFGRRPDLCRYCGRPLDTADLVCVRMCDRCCRTGKDVAAARRRG